MKQTLIVIGFVWLVAACQGLASRRPNRRPRGRACRRFFLREKAHLRKPFYA